MGRPSGKSKKMNGESDEDASVGGGEEEVSVSPTPPKTKRRRGRPAHKPLKDDGTGGVEAEDDKDAGEVEEDGAKPAGNDTAVTGGGGKKRRRRRARVKRGYDDDPVGEDGGVGEGHVRSNSRSRGFRPNGSRRKSTPRRAAEAGVGCK